MNSQQAIVVQVPGSVMTAHVAIITFRRNHVSTHADHRHKAGDDTDVRCGRHTFKDERRNGLGLTLKMKGGTAFHGTIPPLFTINTRSREC